jgi:hypothetical protein
VVGTPDAEPGVVNQEEAFMQGRNGIPHAGSDHHVLEAQMDALRSGVRRLIDRISTNPEGEPSRVRRFADQATATIKAHPFAAAAAAIGLGYLVVRLVRR